MQLIKKLSATLLIAVLVFTSVCTHAQGGHTIKGIVKDSLSNEPLALATVSITELEYWAITNEKGEFVFKNIPAGNYTLTISILAYKEVTQKKTVPAAGIENLVFPLQRQTLALSEVIVTAVEKKFGTSSIIKSTAIAHVQPKSLYDVFQLLPGQVTENPTLASPKQIKIRDISDNPNTALGTVLMVDGSPVTNDANMQAFSTTRSGTGTATPGTLGQGTDLRDLSAENIESVEVIRGIASSEYGNMTAGVVIVKTKIGETPWRANFKTDPNTKIGSLQKGFGLKANRGVISAGMDYAKAYDDIRLKYRGYERITGTLGYGNTFFKKTAPLSFNLNTAWYQTLDQEKSDPQQLEGEVTRSGKQGLRVGINGKWMLRKKWITSMEYNFSGDYAHIKDYNRDLLVISSGAVPYPTSLVSGEFAASYLPGVFYSDYTMDGRPYNLFAKIKGELVHNKNNISNKLLGGIDYSTSGNKGNGLTYDISRPPMNMLSVSSRPRPYNSIPPLHNFSVFAEDRLQIPIAATALTIQGGLRLAWLNPGNKTSVEPRLILAYELLNKSNNHFFDRLAINGGWGISAKMPALIHLTPDKAYFDEVSLNFLDKDYNLAVITTNVVDKTDNPALKPARNTKKELGIDFSVARVSGTITAYHEKLTDVLDFSSIPYFNRFRKFTPVAAGKTPVFENGNVYYMEGNQKVQAGFTYDTTIRTYNRPVNNGINIKKGIEYTINAGSIKALKTSLIIDGGWLYEEQYNTLPTYKTITGLHQGALYPYIAVMPAGSKTVRTRLNSSFRVVTHIPVVRMVTSLTTQVIWRNTFKYLWEDENGIPQVYYYKNGNRVDGSTTAYDYMQDTRFIDPVGFVDKKGVYHAWDKSFAANPLYIPMISTIGSPYYYVQELLPAAVQLNLRLTKEFGQNLSVSFMANNFLKMNPYQLSNRTGLLVQRNTSLYFGAELNVKF